ncbi:hypothetical protein H6B15_06015 [Gemmiger formicilis]|nr:hypothetical protein [Gemmiger formicilis]
MMAQISPCEKAPGMALNSVEISTETILSTNKIDEPHSRQKATKTGFPFRGFLPLLSAER